jgi:seryl-tRNA synthetase
MDKALPPTPRPRQRCQCGGNARSPLTAGLKRENEELKGENERLSHRIQELLEALQKEQAKGTIQQCEQLREQVQYRNTVIDVQNDALRSILNFVHITASDCMAKLGKKQQDTASTPTTICIRNKPSDTSLGNWL